MLDRTVGAVVIGRFVTRPLIEMIYPRRCAGCGRRGVWVCPTCDAALRRLTPPWCPRCGAPPGVLDCRCAELAAGLHAVRSAAPYDGWLQEAIIAFKYHFEWSRADELAALLAPAITDVTGIDALVPVPLHPSRLRWRGFNQATLLAEGLARRTGIPPQPLLDRTRATDQQAQLGAAERWLNVTGAFGVPSPGAVAGRHLLLVDDVYTTGATLGACADALMAGGAARVSGVTLAREQ